MRLNQAAVVAILAFTVAATPIQARQDVQTTDHKSAPDHYMPKCFDKHGKEVACGKEHEQQPDKSAFAVTTKLSSEMILTSIQSLMILLRKRSTSTSLPTRSLRILNHPRKRSQNTSIRKTQRNAMIPTARWSSAERNLSIPIQTILLNVLTNTARRPSVKRLPNLLRRTIPRNA